MPGRLADGLFWIVAALAVLCGFLFILVLSGRVSTESANDAGGRTPTIRTTEPPDATTTVRSRPNPNATPSAAPPARKAAQATTVVLAATRGDCWFQARAGSAQGRLLAERVLSQGESTTITSPRVWVALGAAETSTSPSTASPGSYRQAPSPSCWTRTASRSRG